ncbi:MIZU-KUSSEI 1 protein [Nymphaea thermarum]|nr:MIZU-KUSSEI 1 protein [Nymphaea thermarum]
MPIIHHEVGGGRGAVQFMSDAAAVDCQKQMKCWRLFRSLLELLIPCCGCSYVEHEEAEDIYVRQPSVGASGRTEATITGTIFGRRKGRVSFCIQHNSKATTPALLLDLAVPTRVLAREMMTGLLRISLECNVDAQKSGSLFSVPVWTMYFNGKKVGLAIRRNPTKADLGFLKVMRSVFVGAGIVGRKTAPENGLEEGCPDELMYFRANFKRVSGSGDSESFHLINPDGNVGQELSIFFRRSRKTKA